MEEILEKWYDSKKKLEEYEEQIKKYKCEIVKQMNKLGKDKISTNNFTVSRRRNIKRYLSKESVPVDLWNKYSIQCNYDSFFLKKNQK
jgi:hypothetical protein